MVASVGKLDMSMLGEIFSVEVVAVRSSLGSLDVSR